MDTKLLTYAELAVALGITPASAKRLAIRRAWHKQPGNDGKARVAVPIERLESEPPVTGDIASAGIGDIASDDISGATGDALMAVTVLTRHIERLEHELTMVSAERDAERARAVQVAVLEAVLDIERARISEVRENAEGELRAVREERDHLKLLLDRREHLADSHSRSWWRRIVGH